MRSLARPALRVLAGRPLFVVAATVCAVSCSSGTSPTIADVDGDGLNDGDEIDAGTNPNLDGDSDGDGVPDSDELLSGGNPFDPSDQP